MGSRRFLGFMGKVLAISAAVTLLASAAWAAVPQIIYNFAGDDDGEYLDSDLVIDGAGNLYGTAVTGGGGSCEGGCGVAYKLTNSGGVWTQTVIHAFTGGDDGSGPGTGLTLGRYGTLYGMTPTGGANGQGVVFLLRPMQNGAWNLKG